MSDENVDLATALKQANEAEAQAAALEKMLDDLDDKMNSLIEIMDLDIREEHSPDRGEA